MLRPIHRTTATLKVCREDVLRALRTLGIPIPEESGEVAVVAVNGASGDEMALDLLDISWTVSTDTTVPAGVEKSTSPPRTEVEVDEKIAV